MKLTHLRNATMLIEMGEQRVLLDPMLGAAGAYDPFPNPLADDRRNPTVDLPVPASELLNVDVVVLTHTHIDHWDPAAAALLPRSMPIIVQNQTDATELQQSGFTNVYVVLETETIAGIRFSRTDAQHGSDAVLERLPGLGDVSGWALEHSGEPTVYFAGDTVWNNYVRTALTKHRPDVIVLNTGQAQLGDDEAIIMGHHDVLRVHEAAPEAHIVAVHMEALNHCSTTRADVREVINEHALGDHVSVPDDGASLVF